MQRDAWRLCSVYACIVCACAFTFSSMCVCAWHNGLIRHQGLTARPHIQSRNGAQLAQAHPPKRNRHTKEHPPIPHRQGSILYICTCSPCTVFLAEYSPYIHSGRSRFSQPSSPTTVRTSKVFPQPGGPCSSNPLGHWTPKAAPSVLYCDGQPTSSRRACSVDMHMFERECVCIYMNGLGCNFGIDVRTQPVILPDLRVT